jgi:hypothetical protein
MIERQFQRFSNQVITAGDNTGTGPAALRDGVQKMVVVEISTVERDKWFGLFETEPDEAAILEALSKEPECEKIRRLKDVVRRTDVVKRAKEMCGARLQPCVGNRQHNADEHRPEASLALGRLVVVATRGDDSRQWVQTTSDVQQHFFFAGVHAPSIPSVAVSKHNSIAPASDNSVLSWGDLGYSPNVSIIANQPDPCGVFFGSACVPRSLAVGIRQCVNYEY